MTWKHIPTANHNKKENKVLVCNRRRQAFLFYVSGVRREIFMPYIGLPVPRKLLKLWKNIQIHFFHYCFAKC